MVPVPNSFLLTLSPSHMHVHHEACHLVSLGALHWDGVGMHPGHSHSQIDNQTYLGLLSIPQPRLRKAQPIFSSAPSVPSRNITRAVLSLGTGLGGGSPLSCLLTFASTPETRAH